MSHTVRRLLFWAPRVLGILYLLFIARILLVFDPHYMSPTDTISQFHYFAPAVVFVIALGAAWWKSWFGGLLYIALGCGFLFMTWERVDPGLYEFILAPALVIGVLFLVSGLFGQSSALTRRKGIVAAR